MLIVPCHKRDSVPQTGHEPKNGSYGPLTPLKLEYFGSEKCVRSTNIIAFQVYLHLLTQVKKSCHNVEEKSVQLLCCQEKVYNTKSIQVFSL